MTDQPMGPDGATIARSADPAPGEGPDPLPAGPFADTPRRPADDPEYEWAPAPSPPPRPVAGIALWLSIAALGVSLVVGWGFPIGLAGIAVGVAALRRPGDRRGVAIWAIGLALLSLVYSAGWLVWAVGRL